ncbi:DeoR family transcriptional regulator [Motilibacter rhizosphaerae]|uniref:DeoR family transcriptional regulator n=1 Tax=Motilibacter rhizosphaerae TaxID=598652 RepID=A0A4Q7NWX3_9ACTN|nr:DeoR/GlpR family DNA-binding transcription regulator [Motilibacter rhizosphaerae]RZS90902.1 DeoR family transcriptional regulator [Motilibacter rhizosphaerae]
MRRAERLSAILDQVSASGSVDVVALADAMGVSGATIRRDLQSLSASRLLVRTHGGALANEVGEELPVRVKAAQRQPEKRRIGQAAAALVEDGAVIGLSGGSTSMELARSLGERRGITVVTNAINIAAELAGRPGLRLVVVGGIVRQSFEMVGPAAEAMLANYHLDIAFIGVDGLSPEEGCTTHDEMEAQTDRAFVHRAHRTVVIADSSKIGRVTFARISPLSGVHDVVTDRAADPEQLRRLKEAGVQVVTV